LNELKDEKSMPKEEESEELEAPKPDEILLEPASSGDKGLVQSGQFADYLASEQSRKERNIFQ
jgi:hypothetical protein